MVQAMLGPATTQASINWKGVFLLLLFFGSVFLLQDLGTEILYQSVKKSDPCSISFSPFA